MRKNYFLSPITDLFMALGMIFFVMMASATEEKKTRSTDALHYQKIILGRDGAFRFASTSLTLESAFHAKQSILNRIHMIRSHWVGLKGIEDSTIHFRILTNSDPLLSANEFGNWNRSMERALEVLRIGFCEEETFNDLVRKSLSRQIEEAIGQLQDTSTDPENHTLDCLHNATNLLGQTTHWLYAFNTPQIASSGSDSSGLTPGNPDQKSFPREISYIFLWAEKGKGTRGILMRRSKFKSTRMMLLQDGDMTTDLRAAVAYREQHPDGPTDFSTLYTILSRQWRSVRQTHHIQSLDETGLAFETDLIPGGTIPEGKPMRFDRIHDIAPLKAYIPFFQIATKGSYDSFSPNDARLSFVIGQLYRKLQKQLISRTKDTEIGTTPLGIEKLLGIDDMAVRLPPPEPGQTAKDYCAQHREEIEFLISCQLSRGYEIYELKDENINGCQTFVISAILDELEKQRHLDFNSYRLSFGTAGSRDNTQTRIGLYALMEKEFEQSQDINERYAAYELLIPNLGTTTTRDAKPEKEACSVKATADGD